MADVVLRFRDSLGDPSLSKLNALLEFGSFVRCSLPYPVKLIDVTVDGRIADAAQVAIEIMAEKGWTFVATDPVETIEQTAQSLSP